MVPIKSVAKSVAKGAANKKAGAKAFHAAYKQAPAPTLGAYAKTHKFGIGLTAASFAPIHLGSQSARRSSHEGIAQKARSRPISNNNSG